MKLKTNFICILAGTALLLSCKDSDLFHPDVPVKKEKSDFFEFLTTHEYQLNVDYGLKDYPILFEIYTEDPFTTTSDGETVKKEIEPVFRAATDANGSFSGKISLPAALTQIYINSDYIGALQSVPVSISGDVIDYNQSSLQGNAARSSRAFTPSGYKYPDGFLTLGNWDIWGEPEYLLPEKGELPAGMLYGITKLLDWNPLWKVGRDSLLNDKYVKDIVLSKPTKIKLVFLKSGASMQNTVGYYTYKKGEAPQGPDEVTKIIAFPHSSSYFGKTGIKHVGALNTGDQVQLKYWDGEKFVDEFPADVCIGWFIIPAGFNKGNVEVRSFSKICYSNPSFNSDNKQRTVSLFDSNSGEMVAIGFEDKDDFNYSDAIFYFDFEKGAVDEDIVAPIPPVTPTDEENKSTVTGTLVFEDNWPAQGDYDMNDVVVDYTSTTYKRISNNLVYKVVDTFTARHDGADYRNGFGYQFVNLSANDIKSITVESDYGVVSSYMQGQSLEPGQEKPTVILCDNFRDAVAKNAVFKVTMELKNECPKEYVAAPHNPFIFINNVRGKEVHLVNYPPTSLAEVNLFATEDDLSRPAEQLYYVSDVDFPFALNISGVKFDYPAERERIDVAYPKFTDWVKSGGTMNKEWYKK